MSEALDAERRRAAASPVASGHGSVSGRRLSALIEQATVDAYNDCEQTTGLVTMIEENLEVPFVTRVLGVQVTVESVDLTEDERIVAVCSRSGDR